MFETDIPLCPICKQMDIDESCTVTTTWKKYRGTDPSFDHYICIDCWDNVIRKMLDGRCSGIIDIVKKL